MIKTNEEKIREAEAEVEALIKAGAPMANMEMFNTLDHYVPSEKVKNQVEFTIDIYKELVEQIHEYPEEFQSRFLDFLKRNDVRDNQSIEKEDMFMISFNAMYDKEFAIDKLLDRYGKVLTSEDFEEIHDLLLAGSSSSDKKGYRFNNLKFVGVYNPNVPATFRSGDRVIEYFPIDYRQIEAAVDKLLDYYNHHIKDLTNEYDVLIKPMVFHGLVAALQLFQDGNTRYGRLFQSVEMFELLNQQLGLDLPLPIVYATRQYAGFRDQYRNLVKKLVIENNEQAWEEWFLFNMNRIQDAIWYNEMKLKELRRRM